MRSETLSTCALGAASVSSSSRSDQSEVEGDASSISRRGSASEGSTRVVAQLDSADDVLQYREAGVLHGDR